MTDDLRRQDDRLAASLDKRMALIEQSHELQNEAAKARSQAHDAAIAALTAKVDAAIVLWQTVTAEPGASPAGRSLAADLRAVSVKVEEHDDFIVGLGGAMRFARVAFGTSVVSAVASIVAIVALIGGQP